VVLPDGSQVTIDVSPSDDSDALKQKIEAAGGPEIPRQVVKDHGTGGALPDKTPCSKMGVKPGSTLLVDLHVVPVNVVTYMGDKFTILVEPTSTIGNVKAQCEPESHIEASNMRIFKDSVELTDDAATAKSNCINEGDTIYVEPKVISVNITDPGGNAHVVDLKLSDDGETIRRKIEEVTGIAA
jgi:hypothetical protein